MEKYKLIITIEWFKSKLQKTRVKRAFVWEHKEDALACKKLLEISEYSRAYTAVEFVSFTEEQPL